jgi:CheY-like chemotaxis protein
MEKQFILLVEDNPDDVALTLRALRKNHVRQEVVVARDGVEALNLLLPNAGNVRKERSLPGLVILDLKLPRVDGIEVLRKVRGSQRTRLVPVVVLTSSNEERDIAQCYGLGANSYIRKPVDYARFNDAMRQVSAYWLGLNEPAPEPRSV